MNTQEGTRVKIIYKGLIYPWYKAVAEKMQLRNFEYGYEDIHDGDIGKIIKEEYHEYNGTKLYAVKMSKSGKDIIIGHRGVEHYKCNFLKMEDNLFRI